MPPPGLLRLGGACERAGIDVVLEDLPHRLTAGRLPEGDELADRAAELLLERGEFDLIGLSVMGATLPIALAIAERLRALAPTTRLAVGGPGTTGVDVALLERFPALDVVVRGEAELTLVELVERLGRDESLAGLAGITHRSKAGVVREADRRPIDDLSTLPPLAWHLVEPFERYAELAGGDEGLIPIDSGRGCVYDCSFCTIGRYWSRRSRPLPVPELVREILDVKARPGAANAYLCHDLFGADRKHALALCAELEALGAPVPWEARARVDHLDDELVEAMGRAGCYRVLLGIESASHAVRQRHSKNMAADVDVLAAVERLANARIVPILSLILGLPGETDADLRATLDLACDAAQTAGVNVSLHLVNPQPGCGLGEEFGATSRPVEGIAPDMALGTGTTAAERELIASHPDLFSTYALLTGEPGGEAHLRRLHRIAVGLPNLLEKRPRTFARLATFLGCDTLDTFESLATADGPDALDRLATESGDAWLRSTARWECALDESVDGLATPLELDADPTRPKTDGAPVCLAVVRHGDLVRTTRISPPLALALAEIRRAPDRARHDDPRVDALRRAGLIPATV